MRRLSVFIFLAFFTLAAQAQSGAKPVIYVDVQAQGKIATTDGYPLDAQSVRLQVGQLLTVRGYPWQSIDNRPQGDVTIIRVHYVVNEKQLGGENLAVASASVHLLDTVHVNAQREVNLSIYDNVVQTVVNRKTQQDARIKLRIAFAQALTSRLNEALNTYENHILAGGR